VVVESLMRVCFPKAAAARMLRALPAGIACDVHVPAPRRLGLANASVVSIALEEAAPSSPVQLIIPSNSKTAMLHAHHNACDLLGLANACDLPTVVGESALSSLLPLSLPPDSETAMLPPPALHVVGVAGGVLHTLRRWEQS
jgi:hypothetical protein